MQKNRLNRSFVHFDHLKYREELFQKGKDSLLDKIVELQNLDPGEFESELRERLWRDVRDNFLKEVYLAAEGGSKDKDSFFYINNQFEFIEVFSNLINVWKITDHHL